MKYEYLSYYTVNFDHFSKKLRGNIGLGWACYANYWHKRTFLHVGSVKHVIVTILTFSIHLSQQLSWLKCLSTCSHFICMLKSYACTCTCKILELYPEHFISWLALGLYNSPLFIKLHTWDTQARWACLFRMFEVEIC